jgi:hypothetical protein
VSGFKAVDSDDDSGVVETFVSLTGLKDNVNDIIEPGAYGKSLKERTPKGVWHHTWQQPISRTVQIKELLPGDPELPKVLRDGSPWPDGAGALYVKTLFNLKTQRGRDAYEDVKFFGDQQEWSIGYNVPKGGATTDTKTGVRHIHNLDLYEYSPVLFGAMPSAHTASVKDAQMAYKALNNAGDETNYDLPTDDDDDWEPVYVGGSDDTSDEEKVWGFLDDEGYFTKAEAVTLSAAQATRLTRAATALIELLRDSTMEIPAPKGNAPRTRNEDDGEDRSLRDLVAEAFGEDNEDVLNAADAFDDAWHNGDGEGMESAASDIADAVEEDGNVDPTDITDYLQNAFDDVNESEGDDEEDTEKKVVIDITEFKDVLSD